MSILKEKQTKVRIMFYYAYGSNFTGAPRVVINLLENLDLEQIDPIFVTQKESELTKYLQAKNFTVKIIPLPKIIAVEDGKVFNYSLFRKIKAFQALLSYNKSIGKFISENSIDCVWARNIKSVLLVSFSARLSKIPCIWDIGLERESLSMKPIHWLGLLLSNTVVTEAKCQYNKVFGSVASALFSRKLKTIYPGISINSLQDNLSDIELNKSHNNNRINILNVATIHPRKNQMMLLKGASQLLSKYPNIQISFAGSIGDKAYFDECQEFVSNNNLSKNVTFLGWQDNVSKLMRQNDFLVLCSNNEGIPYVIHEAMHLNLPVIATDVGGIPEIVQDRINGFLVRKGNLDELITVLDECFACIGTEVISKIKESAYSTVNGKFSLENWSRSYNELFSYLSN